MQWRNEMMIHLVLHFDINETILLGDDAGGDTYEQCIHKIIAKSAFVRVPVVNTLNPHHHNKNDKTYKNNNSNNKRNKNYHHNTNVLLPQKQRRYTSKVVPTHWWDGTPMEVVRPSNNNNNVPSSQVPSLWTQWEWPPYNACPYYRTSYKKKCHNFTQHDGNIYYQSHFLPIYHSLHPNRWDNLTSSSSSLLKEEDSNSNSNSITPSIPSESLQKDNSPTMNPTRKTMAQMLPAFFDTLIALNEWCHQSNYPSNTFTTSGTSPPSSSLPQFYQITIVLRTFGSDLPLVMAAIQLFLNGQHPEYPQIRLDYIQADTNNIVRGRWIERTTFLQQHDPMNRNNPVPPNNFEYQLLDDNDTTIASGDANVVQWLHSLHLNHNNDTNQCENSSSATTEMNHQFDVDTKHTPSQCDSTTTSSPTSLQKQHQCSITIGGIQDDYDHWSKYYCVPWAGKPIWKLFNQIPPKDHDDGNENNNNSDVQYHHVLFDDNIHNLEHNSIACVREEVKPLEFRTLSGMETIREQGRHLIRVPTIEPILNHQWFIEQIKSVLQDNITPIIDDSR